VAGDGVIEQATALWDSRDAFEQASWRELLRFTGNRLVVAAPEWRHLDHTSQSISAVKKAVSTSPALSLQPYLVAMANSARSVIGLATGANVSLKSRPSFINCPRMTTRALNCFGVRSCSSMGLPRCLILKTHPAGTGLGQGPCCFHSSPNVPFLMWQLFSRFMASIHWSCDFDLRASPADLGVIVCSCDSVRASSIETGSVGSVVVVSG